MRIARRVWMVVAVAAVLAAWLPAQDAAEDREATAGAEAGEVEAPQQPAADQDVRMVRFLHGSTVVEGRLLAEDAESVRVEKLDGSGIGYRKADLRDLQRYELPVARYYERIGDYYVDRLWDFEDDLADFALARKAYEKSLSLADSQAVREKTEKLKRERRDWQEEFLRRKAVEEADARTEAARLEKEMLELQIESQAILAESIEQQALLIQELQGRIERLQDSNRLVRRRLGDLRRDVERLQDLRRDVERLQDDVYRQWRRIRTYLKSIQIQE